ncbi:AAA family ATPase [Gimesia chilikensis]|uniref:ATPase family associated with various cellular activities (AAA) n=1 Tax=Gimesia chilikensis TaxID=2605989 RepID=A0A517PMT5_9PLAN|nr:MoxR family ATPase [Gimesia chilikensis]MCR9230203.1 MoxR family ATPase [bacterium]QDT20696.1 ATPase family associated with various cellular activities (AAA) [Gimesia chilikensis]QDT84913.1 ATPase family associated with various cellular activities (AAA) [Gimesia chilikensis]QDU02812.1 ATPase family associated with various cellular activities (AAA) [Gimesia chilikensis]
MNLKLVSPDVSDTDERIFEMLQNSRQQIDREISKAVIGQKEIIDQLLIALFAGGHCLITGAPGLAKTLLVNSLAQVFKLKSQRIQFTPDLMPADITGTEILAGDTSESRAMKFVKGPVFTNILLADEINRTPPKTQAALLEAMQEKQVTVTGIRYELEKPFFVLATQNPIEMEGTYPLPEAQLDRFMFNLVIDYLSEDDEVAVVTQTTARNSEPIEPLFTGNDIQQFHGFVREVPVAEEIVRYAVQLCAASRPHQENTPEFINEWVNWGAGLRAAQSLILGAKARAVLRGRVHVTQEDIEALLAPVLRHRVLINYRAEAEGITVEQVVQKLIETIPAPVKG